MKPRLILHIGFGKCGSTTLQRFVLGAQPKLREMGVVVVDGTLSHPGAEPAKNMAQVRMGGVLIQPDAKQQITKALVALRKAMDTHGDKTAFLSSESLSNSHEYPALFKDVADLFDLSVIAYVRPQEDLLPSFWKQSGLRHGRSLNEFITLHMKNMAPNYLQRLMAWENLVRPKNMQVGFLSRTALKEGDLIQDFCSRLKWDFETLQDASFSNTGNPSFDFHILKVMEQAHSIFGTQDIGNIYNFLEEALPQNARKNGTNPLTKKRRHEIHDHYAEQNRTLVARFMKPLTYEQTFGQNPVDKVKNVSGGMDVSLSKTIGYMLVLQAQQNRQNRELRNRIRKLEEKLGDVDTKRDTDV